MISVFLDPHPEEILYSAVARNTSSLNYLDLRSVGVTYFSDPHTIATVVLPCRLEYLVPHLPLNTGHTVDILIDEHALLPFFMPFLLQARVTQLRSNMRGAQGMGVHMRAGLMASTVLLPNSLRFCPTCAAEVSEHHGEWFWHRQHQAPGVHLCSKHHIWLEMSPVLLAHRQTRHVYIASENAISCLPPPRAVLHTPREAKLLAIAQSAEWLLVQKPLPLGLEHLRERHVRALVKRGLAPFTGRVRMSEVLEAFMAFNKEVPLTFLYCHLDVQSQDTWLARLLGKPDSALRPVQHLLLMNFLGETVSDYLLDRAGPTTPFGSGPWPCFNPVCLNYNTCIIRTCTITYPPGLNGQPSGSFACTCGFTYGCAEPDPGRDDMYRRGKIIAVGQVWESELREYWNDASLSVNKLAEPLGVDPRTVRHHAQRLGLSMVGTKKKKALAIPPQRISGAEHDAGVVQPPFDLMRPVWQKACKTHGHPGRKCVRLQILQVYTWLYWHDRDWLEQHLPPGKRLEPPQRGDWTERDRSRKASL